jgi:lipopolysaccharide/colanic/teichoic acid biosynthesis glycosyltransferase
MAMNLDHAESTSRLHVLDRELFRDLLIRERKRAYRSNASFGILRVDVRDAVKRRPPATSAAIVDILTSVKRDTDVVGWLEPGAVIGVILPDLRTSAITAMRVALEARLRGKLENRLGSTVAGRCSIRLDIQPAPVAPGEERRPSADPVVRLGRRGARASATASDAVKRGVDILCSLTLLLFLAPLLVLIAVLVKLGSPGPALFRQIRIGQRMKPFTMLKFRTMYVGMDHRVHHEFVTAFIKAGDGSGGAGFFKLTNDPRITPIGRILRKTSLDELPQLWNVLRGDMSLVGPRPPLPYEIEEYKPWHRRRLLEAKPGITGLWQVAGRSRTTFDDMVRLDLRYAGTRSLWTDVKILLATPAAVISGKGAC